MDKSLQDMFKRQAALLERFDEIERENKSIPDPPVDIDSREGQTRLKEFAWRFTEELTEALVAIQCCARADTVEEFADATHFLLDLWLLAGVDHLSPLRLDGWISRSPISFPSVEDAFTECVMDLGLAMNELKNRPWKKDDQLVATHTLRFYARMNEMTCSFGEFVASVGIEPQEFHDAYFAKSEVNKERQK